MGKKYRSTSDLIKVTPLVNEAEWEGCYHVGVPKRFPPIWHKPSTKIGNITASVPKKLWLICCHISEETAWCFISESSSIQHIVQIWDDRTPIISDIPELRLWPKLVDTKVTTYWIPKLYHCDTPSCPIISICKFENNSSFCSPPVSLPSAKTI